jgi:hypothetical protein
MKLFYRVSPDKYHECMDRIRERFGMHEEVDEASTILMLEDDSQVQKVTGTFDPNFDDFAQVRVNLKDTSLKDFFDSVLGEPYKVK